MSPYLPHNSFAVIRRAVSAISGALAPRSSAYLCQVIAKLDGGCLVQHLRSGYELSTGRLPVLEVNMKAPVFEIHGGNSE